MKTIQQATEHLVSQVPFWHDAMDEGLINLSALARRLKPEVEKMLRKRVNTGAVIIALNRMDTSHSLKIQKQLDKFIRHFGDITVKSDIFDITYRQSPTLSPNIAQAINQVAPLKNFFTISNGVEEVTIVASNSLKPIIKEILKEEQLINEQADLASITLNLPKNNNEQSGIYYFILRQLAWINVNILEVISTTNEITIVVANDDVNIALNKLLDIKKLQ